MSKGQRKYRHFGIEIMRDIRTAIIASKMPVTQIAFISGVSESTIYSWLNNKDMWCPQVPTIKAVALAIDCDLTLVLRRRNVIKFRRAA